MKHVRTARSFEALTVTEGEKTYTVTSTPQEVSNEAAAAVEKAAASAGVRVEVSDQPFEAPAIGATVGGQVGVDLSRGVAAISGYGAPVETFDAATATGVEAPVTALEVTDDPSNGGDADNTSKKGK